MNFDKYAHCVWKKDHESQFCDSSYEREQLSERVNASIKQIDVFLFFYFNSQPEIRKVSWRVPGQLNFFYEELNMVQIVFKNLEPSELARGAVRERVEHIVEKFPSLIEHKITATVSVENSPLQAGPDVFGIRLRISGKQYANIEIEKRSNTLYLALSMLCESLLEMLNRKGDKTRMKNRKSHRQIRFEEPTLEPLQSIV